MKNHAEIESNPINENEYLHKNIKINAVNPNSTEKYKNSTIPNQPKLTIIPPPEKLIILPLKSGERAASRRIRGTFS
jgi:hypothetical protein